MCEEGSCPSIPTRCCGIFYSIYCIVIGAICVATLLFDLPFGDDETPYFVRVYGVISIVMSILYLVAGILLLVGILKEKKKLFQVGKVLSYFWPITHTFFIFPLIVHIISVCRLCPLRDELFD